MSLTCIICNEDLPAWKSASYWDDGWVCSTCNLLREQQIAASQFGDIDLASRLEKFRIRKEKRICC